MTSSDLEFTRAHFHKSVKHGLIALDERVFQIYTPSLLHAKSAIQQYKLKEYLLNDFDPLSEVESTAASGLVGEEGAEALLGNEPIEGLGMPGDKDGQQKKKQNEINLTSLNSLV